MNASSMRGDVRRMIENEGVYITGSTVDKAGTMIVVSHGGKLFSTMLDRELSTDGFLDDFYVKMGPLK